MIATGCCSPRPSTPPGTASTVLTSTPGGGTPTPSASLVPEAGGARIRCPTPLGSRALVEFTDEFRPETLLAIEAVKRAFCIARRGVAAEEVTAKGARDLVTAADVAVEDAVRGVVADALGFA